MKIPVSQQLIQAALSLALGAAAGFLYDFLRAIRHRANSSAATAFLDLVFVAALTLALLVFGMTVGDGRSRIFMSALAILGGALYFMTFTRMAQKVCSLILDAVLFILRCLVWPLALAAAVIKKIVILSKNIFIYHKKWYTIKIAIKKNDRRAGWSRGAPGGGTGFEAETGRYNYENSGVRAGGIRRGDAAEFPRKNRGGRAGSSRHTGADRR